MMNIHFLRPEMLLWGAGAMAFLALVLWYGFQLRLKARARYGEEHLVSRFNSPMTKFKEFSIIGAWVVAVGLLFAAIAGPIAPDAPVKVPNGMMQVVVVTDVSLSMAAEDYRPFMPPKDGLAPADVPGPYGTRLQVVKSVVTDEIMPAIAGNEIGVVNYMGKGWNVTDLTSDFSYVRRSLRMVKIDNAPGEGSDIGEGLKTAISIFEATPAPDKERVIVLFTDGGNTVKTDESLDQAAEALKKANIRVVIIAVGGDVALPIPEYDPRTGQQIGAAKDKKTGETVATALEMQGISKAEMKLGEKHIRYVPGQKLNIQWAVKFAGSHSEPNESDMYYYPLGASMFIIFALLLRGIIPARRRKTS